MSNLAYPDCLLYNNSRDLLVHRELLGDQRHSKEYPQHLQFLPVLLTTAEHM